MECQRRKIEDREDRENRRDRRDRRDRRAGERIKLTFTK
jgi:hypothetical protein